MTDRRDEPGRGARRRFGSSLLLVAIAACGVGFARSATAAASAGRDPGAGYVATITGECEELVIDSRIVPACGGSILTVDFANGRVAFVFAGTIGNGTVVAILSGASSRQPDARTYELTIDRMSTAVRGKGGAEDPIVLPAEGTCAMRGDPARERTRFECRVRRAGRETVARFLNDGSPADVERLTPESEGAAAASPWPGVATH